MGVSQNRYWRPVMPRFQCAAGGLKVQGLSAKLPGYAAEASAAAMPSYRQKAGSRLDP
jgi:hypothetical protein